MCSACVLMLFFMYWRPNDRPFVIGMIISIIIELICIILLCLDEKKHNPAWKIETGSSSTYPITRKPNYGWLLGSIACGVFMVLYFLHVYHWGLPGLNIRMLSATVGLLGIICIIRFLASGVSAYELSCPSCGEEIRIQVGVKAYDCPLCKERILFSEGKFYTAREVMEKHKTS